MEQSKIDRINALALLRIRSSLKNCVSIWEHSSSKIPLVTFT